MRFSDDNPNPERRYEFWRTHGGVGLVWSNPHASDMVMIRKALLRPSFHQLLDIAVEFGLARLKSEWAALQKDYASQSYPEEFRQLTQAEPIVNRCLRNMEAGVKQGV